LRDRQLHWRAICIRFGAVYHAAQETQHAARSTPTHFVRADQAAAKKY